MNTNESISRNAGQLKHLHKLFFMLEFLYKIERIDWHRLRNVEVRPVGSI